MHIDGTLNEEQARELVAGLDEAGQAALRRVLRESERAENSAAIIAEVRRWLAEELDSVEGLIGVVIGAANYDNGWFLSTGSGSPVAVFDTGDTITVEAGDTEPDHALTEICGTVGPLAAVAVDLVRGTVTFDEIGMADDGEALIARLRGQ